MHEFLIDMLACPACHGELVWAAIDRRGDRIEQAEVPCSRCGAQYFVRDGIGLFLTTDLDRDDSWEKADSQLMQYLHHHPDVEHQLMGIPLDELNPADQLLRSFVLEERSDDATARITSDIAIAGLYTLDYLAGSASQFHFVIDQLSAADGPMVDLASGKGYLVEDLARRLMRPIIATDFSPRVLRGNRRRLEFFDLYDHVSLVACDARRLPFKDHAIKTMTTNLGLANIRQPGEVLKELRRTVGGALLAIHHFYPEDDAANAEAIRKIGLTDMLFEASAKQLFSAAGWQMTIANERPGQAKPTSASRIFDGVTIDTLPAVETILRWCTLVAH